MIDGRDVSPMDHEIQIEGDHKEAVGRCSCGWERHVGPQETAARYELMQAWDEHREVER